MKKTSLLFIFLLSAVTLIADEAPVQPVQGGSVKPVINEDIRMQSEVIKIYLSRTNYRVEVEYIFVNSGPAQQVIMGFPNYEGDGYSVQSIQDFKAYENEKKLFVFRQDGAEQPDMKTYYGAQLYYECSEVYFEVGETKIIKNTYTQEYLRDYDDSFRKAEYILTTGAYWKGDIEKIEVFVTAPGIPESHLLGRTAHVADYGYDEIVNYDGLRFNPARFDKKSTGYYAVFNNVDPDFNIEITMPSLFSYHADATGTLDGQSGNTYGAENLWDNDPATAWVEGEKGSGIGEEISLYCTPRIAGGKIAGNWLIDGLGIINGYAKNDAAFNNNNRVKKIRLKIEYYENGEMLMSEKIFTLKDTKKLQRINLPEKTEAAQITLEILEVYKGAKYDDTCISEIVFYPSQVRF